MDEEALLLSEVYTAIEIESLLGSGKKRQLKDYREMFRGIKSEGARILLKGDPGIGKTTFSHKVAFDWATGCLKLFNVVLVVKLKLANCNQSIEYLVKEQIPSLQEIDDVTPSLISEYLRSGQDRVLVILDGLDEINLKQYPRVQDVLSGKTLTRCCVLATTRPYAAREVKGRMTSVAHLKGFSRLKAEEFIQHVIVDPGERKRFFNALDRRKMSHMHRVPLLVQALALLFNEAEELPETFTTTYDELVFYLRKTCKGSKGLTKEEIREAMNEVNELAFKGLIKEDKQLVFSREEIKNENIYKLGLLSGDMTERGSRASTVVQFAHATIQENCGADHVVRRLEANDREPWNSILTQFRKTFKTNVVDVSDNERKNFDDDEDTPQENVPEEEEGPTQTKILGDAVEKFVNALGRQPNRNAAIVHMLNALLDVGTFDEEVEVASIWDEYIKYPLVVEALNEGEKEAMFDYIAQEMLLDTTPEWRAQQKRWVEGLTEHDHHRLFTYFSALPIVVSWIKDDPDMAKEKLKGMAGIFTHQGNLPTQSVQQDFSHLWDHLGSYRTLFRFIIGKLPSHLVQEILLEITQLAVEHSFDANSGGVLPFDLLKSQLIEALAKENKSIKDGKDFLENQVLILLDKKHTAQVPQNEHGCSAVKISGTGADSTALIPHLSQQVAGITNIRTVEIEDFEETSDDRSKQLVKALYQSQPVSLELRNLDSQLISLLTQDLPASTQRLSISRSPISPTAYSFRFPPTVNLVCLYLEDCTATVADVVEPCFPKLKKLVIITTAVRGQGNIAAIHRAVQDGRMPQLETLIIRFGHLQGSGQILAEILRQPTVRNAEFPGGDLTQQDGEIILKHIQQGHLDHVCSLSLSNNESLRPLVEEFKTSCTRHRIQLEISLPPRQPTSFLDLLPMLNSRQTSAVGKSADVDLGALVSSLAPLLTSSVPSDQRRSSAKANLGNVLFSVLNTANTSQPQQGPTSNPFGGAPSLSSASPRDHGNPLGNIFSSILGATRPPKPSSGTSSTPAGGTARSTTSVGTDVGFDLGSILSSVLTAPSQPSTSFPSSAPNPQPPAPANQQHRGPSNQPTVNPCSSQQAPLFDSVPLVANDLNNANKRSGNDLPPSDAKVPKS